MPTLSHILFLVVALSLLVIVPAALVLRAMDRRLAREGKGDVQSFWARRQRLFHPKWNELEASFGNPMPVALRNLYADRRTIGRTDVELAPVEDDDGEPYWVASFMPADAEAQLARRDHLQADYLQIAEDDFGNAYLVRLIGRHDDPCPVYYLDQEADNEPVCVAASLEQFTRRLRG